MTTITADAMISDGDDDHGHDHDDDATRTVVITGPGGTAFTRDEGKTWSTFTGLTGFWGVAFADSETGWRVGVTAPF